MLVTAGRIVLLSTQKALTVISTLRYVLLCLPASHSKCRIVNAYVLACTATLEDTCVCTFDTTLVDITFSSCSLWPSLGQHI